MDGKVSALIELGAGFHPEISGRENVVINGVMLGLTRREIERKLPEIIAFSGLEDFIDEPVKTYSSGMYVRLGFAVAVHVDPDILVVDEVLAVGDEAFAHRCLDTIADFSRRGKTIFFVSHSLVLVEELCDRVLYLENGRDQGARRPQRDAREIPHERRGGGGRTPRDGAPEGPGDSATARFEKVPSKKKRRFPMLLESRKHNQSVEQPLEQRTLLRPTETRRWGNRDVSITGCRLLDASGAERYAFGSGESMTIEISVEPRVSTADFVFGIGIFTPDDVCVHGSNTEIDGFLPERLDGPATVRVTLPRLDLGTGTYLVDVAVHSRRETPYDYWRERVPLPGGLARSRLGPLSPRAPLDVRGRGLGERPVSRLERVDRTLLALLLLAVLLLVFEPGKVPLFEPDEGRYGEDSARDARLSRLPDPPPERRPLLREAAALLLVGRGVDGAPRPDGARGASPREARGGVHGPPRGRLRQAAMGSAHGARRGPDPRDVAPSRRARADRAHRSDALGCARRRDVRLRGVRGG